MELEIILQRNERRNLYVAYEAMNDLNKYQERMHEAIQAYKVKRVLNKLINTSVVPNRLNLTQEVVSWLGNSFQTGILPEMDWFK